MKNNNIFKPTSFFVSTDNLSANNGQIAVIQLYTGWSGVGDNV